MDKTLPWPRDRGLTLIELLVTLIVLSITLTAGAPALQRLVQGNHLRAEAARLISALNLARSEAILRNSPVSLCPGEAVPDTVAACDGVFADGWIIFSNPDRDSRLDAPAEEFIRSFAAIPDGYTLSNRSGTRPFAEIITYLPDGSSRRNRTLLLCAPVGATLKGIGIVLNRVGRARVEQGDGTCPSVAT